jgi:putative addiction module antidote
MNITIPSPQRVRKVGNSLVVTIPADVAEQHNIKADDLMQITLTAVEQVTIPRLDPELQGMLDQVLERHHEDLEYLRDH